MSTEPTPWYIQETLTANTVVKTGDHSTHIYTPGGQIVRVLGSFISSRADTSFRALVAATHPDILDPGPVVNLAWTTTQQDWDAQPGVGAWPAQLAYASNLYVAWQRQDTDITLDAETVSSWSNLIVVHRRYNYAGGLVDVSGAGIRLDVRQVVHDLMGRGVNRIVEFCPARVDPDTPWDSVVEHAAWWWGVSAKEVLAFCITHAPNMWWAVWEPGPSMLPKFEIGRWNGPIRYIFPTGADVQLSGGAGDVANRALVRYVGTTNGSTKTVWVAEVRANIATLAKAGVTKTVILDLTNEGLMTTAQARLRGIAALQETARTKTTGRVVVRAPIFDRIEGRLVEPWEIRPGSPVIVTSAQTTFGRSTSLTESVGVDGTTVFRCSAVAYDAGRNEATLSLDGGSRSLVTRMKVEVAPTKYEGASPRV